MSAARRLSAVPSAPARKTMADVPHWMNPRFVYVPSRVDSLDKFRERMKLRAERVKERA